MLRLRPATARRGDMQTTPANRRTQMYLSGCQWYAAMIPQSAPKCPFVPFKDAKRPNIGKAEQNRFAI
jgi:hypothetical protein